MINKQYAAAILAGIVLIFAACAGSAPAVPEPVVQAPAVPEPAVLEPAVQGSAAQDPAVLEQAVQELIKNSGFPAGIDWYLAEVNTPEKTVAIDRSGLTNEAMKDAFSLRFDGKELLGKAWPNRYRAPCALGEGDSLTVGPAASTLMAAFQEIEGITERDFFRYLGQVDHWTVMPDGRLKLYAAGAAGETALVFDKL